MGYRYLGLLPIEPSRNGIALSPEQSASLCAQGMRQVDAPWPMTLFVGEETPALPVPAGVVVGHVFSRDGAQLEANTFASTAGPRTLDDHLLTQCWGEYLLIRRAAPPAQGVTLLREPSGGVPCFYFSGERVTVVTSDVSLASSLGLYRRQIDWNVIAWLLAYTHVNTAETPLDGVKELLPGCALTLHDRTATVVPAWSPWRFAQAPHRHHSPERAASAIGTAVRTVVETWARIDKAVLMELSGGLDSSIVAACLKGDSANVTCSTLVTPVPGADERRYAQPVADMLGTQLHTTMLDIDEVSIDFDLPVQTARPRVSVLQQAANTAMTAVATSQGANSFFSGGGGDTVFCYSSGAVPAADAFKERGVRAGVRAIRDLSALHDCTYWKAGRLTLKKLARGARTPCKPNPMFLDASAVSPSPPVHPWFARPNGALPGDLERIAELAGTQVFREGAPRGATRWLRLPLLSQPVVEACLQAPTWMWIAGGRNRALARDAFADRLPRAVLERRSKGTFVSYSGAIYQRKRREMRAYLMEGHLRRQGLLDARVLEAFFATNLHPRDTAFMRIFDLCMVENWLRHPR
ncbi:asparagine synthase C-terminal domain-containing protein [Luteimonas sp. gir]|uniref:asparagine synthase C-terminal domain-containing protein n=1 Tax=Luteimonas sp. gir TaxID=3127960 RepID=UPI003075B993